MGKKTIDAKETVAEVTLMEKYQLKTPKWSSENKGDK